MITMDAVEVLTSRQNPLIKKVRTAFNQGGLTAEGYLPIEGPTLLMEAFKSQLHIETVLAEDPSLLDAGLYRSLRAQRTKFYRVSGETVRYASDTQSPQGILALVRPPSWELDALVHASRGLFLVLVALQDPGNLGTIIRSADAFGVTAIFTTRNTVSIHNPKAVRSSTGSVFRVPVVAQVDEDILFRKFKLHRITTMAATLKARAAIHPEHFKLPLALVVGQEAGGLPADIVSACKFQCRIPTRNSVQSLNVALATGILLYEIRRHEQLG